MEASSNQLSCVQVNNMYIAIYIRAKHYPHMGVEDSTMTYGRA
jgi:hypothetical protein